jgi:hypothetical protein
MKIRGGGARSSELGGGAFEGQTHIWGGGNVEFSKRYCYLPMPLSQNFRPPPFKRGAIFLEILNTLEILPPFRIFALQN